MFIRLPLSDDTDMVMDLGRHKTVKSDDVDITFDAVPVSYVNKDMTMEHAMRQHIQMYDIIGTPDFTHLNDIRDTTWYRAIRMAYEEERAMHNDPNLSAMEKRRAYQRSYYARKKKGL